MNTIQQSSFIIERLSSFHSDSITTVISQGTLPTIDNSIIIATSAFVIFLLFNGSLFLQNALQPAYNYLASVYRRMIRPTNVVKNAETVEERPQ